MVLGWTACRDLAGNQASERLHEKDSETTEPDSDEDSTYGAVDATHEDFRSLQAGKLLTPAHSQLAKFAWIVF